MTPKEKAVELVSKYFKLEFDELAKFNGEMVVGLTSKQCALIAVYEIINSNPQSPVFKTIIDIHGVKEYIHDYPPDFFWQEVKKEIELL